MQAVTQQSTETTPMPKKPRTWKQRTKEHPQPLKLRGLLIDLKVTQTELAAALKLANTGRPPSKSTVTQIIARDFWPQKTTKENLKKQITKFLQKKGATEAEIETAFDIDDSPEEVVFTRQSMGRPLRRTAPAYDQNQLPETVMLSQQAKKHFALFKDPFVDDVQTAEDVFLSADQRYIREAMYQTAKTGGFIAVIGESGAGKTTLRRDLLDRIARENAPITVIQPRIIDKSHLSTGALCDAIIHDVSHETPKQSLEAKARQIERLLTGSSRSGNKHVLMIEEAHDLSIKTLKYLKRFFELEDGFVKLISIILIGQPELKDSLDERQNWDAREVIRRIEVAELQPLNGNLEEYLAMKLNRIDRKLEDFFDPDAFDAIRQRLVIRMRGNDAAQSMMYPLVVNITVTKAMNLAADVGAPRINADIIKEV